MIQVTRAGSSSRSSLQRFCVYFMRVTSKSIPIMQKTTANNDKGRPGGEAEARKISSFPTARHWFRLRSAVCGAHSNVCPPLHRNRLFSLSRNRLLPRPRKQTFSFAFIRPHYESSTRRARSTRNFSGETRTRHTRCCDDWNPRRYCTRRLFFGSLCFDGLSAT